MLMAPRIPSSPRAPRMVTRSQRPPGAGPWARSPRGLQAWPRVRFVSAALSSRNTSLLGATPAVTSRQARRSSSTAAVSRSAARRAFFFACQPEAPEGPPDRPGVDPDPCLLLQAVPVLAECQVVVGRDQALEGSLAPTPDRRLGPAPHRLNLQAAPGQRRPDPAVDGRAADPEAARRRLLGLTPSQHCGDHTLAQIARVGSRHGDPPPPATLPRSVPTSPRFALVLQLRFDRSARKEGPGMTN